jgi:hypothetical protein
MDRELGMKITKRQLRRLIKEAGLDGPDPVVVKNIAGKTVDAAWDDSGLTMWIHVNDEAVFSFSSKKEVRELISLLEELLAGPMRTSP